MRERSDVELRERIERHFRTATEILAGSRLPQAPGVDV
jgi:hypothetical protein